MSKLGSLEKLCDPASLDGLIAEFSLVAKRAFEEEGFDPVTVAEVMKKMEAEAEASFAAMKAAEDEQLAVADKLLNDVMDSGMAELDEITRYGSAELKTLTALETATLKVSKRLTAAAEAAANRYLDAALASAAASAAAKSAHKHMRTHFCPGSRVYTVLPVPGGQSVRDEVGPIEKGKGMAIGDEPMQIPLRRCSRISIRTESPIETPSAHEVGRQSYVSLLMQPLYPEEESTQGIINKVQAFLRTYERTPHRCRRSTREEASDSPSAVKRLHFDHPLVA